jgi:hypothetical protein
MADRKAEKEARRQERLAQEEAARKQAARRKAVGRLGGIVLALAAVGAIIALLVTTGGGDGTEGRADSGRVSALAREAGCEFRQLDSEGRDHVEEDVDPADYKSNPPASGPHNPVPAQDGFYQPGNEPNLGNWIHSLEHGRILFQYRPGTPPEQVRQLRELAEEEVNGTAGYHTLVFQNNTDMPRRFAAVGWTRYIACDELNEQTLQAMRVFRETYTDQAPELVP